MLRPFLGPLNAKYPIYRKLNNSMLPIWTSSTSRVWPETVATAALIPETSSSIPVKLAQRARRRLSAQSRPPVPIAKLVLRESVISGWLDKLTIFMLCSHNRSSMANPKRTAWYGVSPFFHCNLLALWNSTVRRVCLKIAPRPFLSPRHYR